MKSHRKDGPTKDQKLEEEYCFLYLARQDLFEAQSAIRAAQRNETLAYFLMRDAIVSYMRPFTPCRGTLIRNHSLPKKWVPKDRTELHKLLESLRKRFFAHTDMPAAGARVMRLLVGSRPLVAAVSRIQLNLAGLLKVAPDINDLIDEIGNAIGARMKDISSKPPFLGRPYVVGEDPDHPGERLDL